MPRNGGEWACALMVYTVYVKAQTTSERIVRAAHRLLELGGAEAVTLRRVAAAVGISAMAVYRHFDDRAALLAALADEGFAELAAQLERIPAAGTAARRFEKLVDAFLDQALANPRMFELMFLRPRAGARVYPRDWRAGRSPTANVWARLLRDAMSAGELPLEDPWALVFTAGAMLEGLLMLYIGGRIGLTAPRFRRLCHESLRKYYGFQA